MGLEAIVGAKPVISSLAGSVNLFNEDGSLDVNNVTYAFYGLPVRKKQKTGKYA